MRIEFPHSMYYDVNRTLTVREIARNLIAQEQLIEEAVELFAQIVPNAEFKLTSVRLVNVETSSLREEFVVAIFAAWQEDIKGEVMDIVEAMTRIDIPERYDAIVTLGVVLVALWAGRKFVEAFSDGKDQEGINNSYNTYINIFSDKTGAPRDVIEKALETRFAEPKRRRSVFRAMSDFFSVARREPGGKIIPQGTPEIGEQAIADLPPESLAGLERLRDQNVPYPNVVLDIRALDKDQTKRGWQARIVNDDEIQRRLPLELYPTVDADSLAKRDHVRADAIVTFRPDEGGELRPRRIHLLRVLDNAPPETPEA